MYRADSAAARLPGRRGRPSSKGGRVAWLMVLPALLLVALFTIYPLGQALWTSLHTSSPLLPSAFVGLKNYSEVLGSEYFAKALQVSIGFTVTTVLTTTLAALGAALVLHETFLGGRILRPLVLLPWAVPLAITGVMWHWIFNPQWGALNAILYSVGLIDQYVPWLGDPALAFGSVVVAQTWSQLPLAVILLLGALQGIPREQYEAAAIDGAHVWRRFRYVTLPGIRTILVIVVLYEVLVGLNTYDITYTMTGGGPGTATTLISYFTWSESFKQLNFGHGAALGVMIALIALVFITALLRAIPRGALSEDQA